MVEYIETVLSTAQALQRAIDDARAGEQVAFFARTQVLARARFLEARALAPDARRVVSINGAERIEFDGGAVSFHGMGRNGFRGRSYSTAYVHDFARFRDDERFMGALLPCFATARKPAYIRAYL